MFNQSSRVGIVYQWNQQLLRFGSFRNSLLNFFVVNGFSNAGINDHCSVICYLGRRPDKTNCRYSIKKTRSMLQLACLQALCQPLQPPPARSSNWYCRNKNVRRSTVGSIIFQVSLLRPRLLLFDCDWDITETCAGAITAASLL